MAYNYILNIKGISASGKSTRLYVLLDYLKQNNFTFEDFKRPDHNGKEQSYGIFIKELNTVVLGKYYTKDGVFRFQGFDAVSGRQDKAAKWSDWLAEIGKDHSIIMEGAGITGSYRFRPRYLKERNPELDLVFNIYYNYEESEKQAYQDRVTYRSGKPPKKDSMWEGRSGFLRDYEMAQDEAKEIGGKVRCVLIYGSYSLPLWDLGVHFFTKVFNSPKHAEAFKEFAENSDYISVNKYSGKPLEETKSTSTRTSSKRIDRLPEEFPSIFPEYSIDRNVIKWEDYLYKFTPCEKKGDMWFKREDKFAPLGYGGINGSKLRQCIWMIKQFTPNRESMVISGASLKSPQLPMGTAVATHYGMKSVHVVGATNPKSSIQRDMVQMATWFGGAFKYESVAYNPFLQSKTRELHESRNKVDFYLNYGITPADDASDEYIHGFHATGAFQVQNIPEHIVSIVIPTGSTNSCISILYGLARFRDKLPNLKNVFLIGIGPDKMKLINSRLDIIRRVSGINTKNFKLTWEERNLDTSPEDNPLILVYHNLFTTGYADYQDEIKYSYAGIEFHPTYEGKVMKWFQEKYPQFVHETTLMWIVGSKPRMSDMEFLKETLGEFPKEVEVYGTYTPPVRKKEQVTEEASESNTSEKNQLEETPSWNPNEDPALAATGWTDPEFEDDIPERNTFEEEESIEIVDKIDSSELVTPEPKKPKINAFTGETGIPVGRATLETSDLKVGDDFREPTFRREVFLNFYEFHLKYKAHPGAVYYVFPYLFEKYNMNTEQKLWFCFINGCTQNVCTTWVIYNKFPNPHEITFEEFEAWHRPNWKKLQYDIDRRYQKGHMVEMWQDYMKNLNGRTQEQFFIEDLGLKPDTPEENFDKVWKKVINNFKWYGRLSTYSYLEYLRIAGLPLDCPTLMLRDKDGSVSPRNGLCKVLGRDDLDWHKSNESFKGYGGKVLDWLEEESLLLLREARDRFKDAPYLDEVNFFTLESTLCCYKSWFRKNRRYPNVYNDMFYDRIVKAESENWDHVTFEDFWECRKAYLPEYLRMEDVPEDLGIHPLKQNWFRNTGQVIMMDKDFPVFKNTWLEDPEVKKAKRVNKRVIKETVQ